MSIIVAYCKIEKIIFIYYIKIKLIKNLILKELRINKDYKQYIDLILKKQIKNKLQLKIPPLNFIFLDLKSRLLIWQLKITPLTFLVFTLTSK